MKNIRILLNENRKKQHLSYRKLSKLTGVKVNIKMVLPQII